MCFTVSMRKPYGIDAEAVAVGERNPILVAVAQRAERARRIERDVLQREEVGALVLGVRIRDIARAETAAAGARVPRRIAEISRQHRIVRPQCRRRSVERHALLMLVAPGETPTGSIWIVRVAVEVGKVAIGRLVERGAG
jgi:hypothetical protein